MWMKRQRKKETGPSIGGCFHTDAPLMGLNDPFPDCQPQPIAVGTQSIERLKDTLALALWNAGTVIDYLHVQHLLRIAKGIYIYDNLCLRGTMRQRILQEMIKDPSKLYMINIYQGQMRLKVCLDGATGQSALHLRQGAMHDLCHVAPLFLEHQGTHLYTRQLDQGVDQNSEVVGLNVNILQHRPIIAFVPHNIGLQQSRHRSFDSGQWRAQIMRHR